MLRLDNIKQEFCVENKFLVIFSFLFISSVLWLEWACVLVEGLLSLRNKWIFEVCQGIVQQNFTCLWCKTSKSSNLTMFPYKGVKRHQSEKEHFWPQFHWILRRYHSCKTSNTWHTHESYCQYKTRENNYNSHIVICIQYTCLNHLFNYLNKLLFIKMKILRDIYREIQIYPQLFILYSPHILCILQLSCF